jgi:hypothetical protein
MNIQPPHARNLIPGKAVTGTYEIKLNGEKFLATAASVFVGCAPPFGCWRDVGFYAPEEVLTRKTVTASLPLDLPPGKYPITGDDTGASGAYLIARKTTSGGWYVTSYGAGEGWFTLTAAVEQTQHMKGSFEFVVMIEGLRQTLSGTFDIQNAAMP